MRTAIFSAVGAVTLPPGPSACDRRMNRNPTSNSSQRSPNAAEWGKPNPALGRRTAICPGAAGVLCSDPKTRLDHWQPGSNMSPSDGLNGAIDLSVRGRRKKSYRFLVLAVGLLIFASLAGAAFLIVRPATLRIAVGPSGSDAQNLIQGLAQAFARDGS